MTASLYLIKIYFWCKYSGVLYNGNQQEQEKEERRNTAMKTQHRERGLQMFEILCGFLRDVLALPCWELAGRMRDILSRFLFSSLHVGSTEG